MLVLAYAAADAIDRAKPVKVQKLGESPLEANLSPRVFIAGSILLLMRLSNVMNCV